MAFTFTNVSDDPITGKQVFSAVTDTTSEASTFYPAFIPRYIRVYDETNAIQFEWFTGQAADSMKMTIATGGAISQEVANGITCKATTSATPGNGPAMVTLGTTIHTNSSTYRISCRK